MTRSWPMGNPMARFPEAIPVHRELVILCPALQPPAPPSSSLAAVSRCACPPCASHLSSKARTYPIALFEVPTMGLKTYEITPSISQTLPPQQGIISWIYMKRECLVPPGDGRVPFPKQSDKQVMASCSGLQMAAHDVHFFRQARCIAAM